MKMFNFFTVVFSFLIFLVEGQTLVSFKVSARGYVTPIVQPYALIHPSKPNFRYPLHVVKDHCKDSATIRSSFFNNYGPKTFSESTSVLCGDEVEVLDKHLYKNDDWVISPDLAIMAGLANRGRDFGAWTKINDRTWQFKSSHRSYSSVVTGSRIVQTWKLDRKKRVKEVVQTNDSGHVTLRLVITYSKSNLVLRITKTIYDEEYYNGNKDFFAQVNQEWFYDKNKRPKMMIKYSGRSRKFSASHLESLRASLASHIRSEKKTPDPAIDSLYMRDLLVYNYGRFGLETVNFCRQEVGGEYKPTYYDKKYVSDSIFYNKNGQIIRYSCPKTWSGYTNKITFSYDTLSGRLNTYFGSSTWAFSDGNNTETAALLLLNYDSNGIITHSQQKRFKKTYRQTEPVYIRQDDKSEEEIEKWYHWK